MMIETGLVCPSCWRGGVTAMSRALSSGLAQCWGEHECGWRVAAGTVPREIPFDVEAAVASAVGRCRDELVHRGRQVVPDVGMEDDRGDR